MSDRPRDRATADEYGEPAPRRFFFDDLQDADGSDRPGQPDVAGRGRSEDAGGGEPDTRSAGDRPDVVAARLVDADEGAEDQEDQSAAGTWADTGELPAPTGFGPTPDLDGAQEQTPPDRLDPVPELPAAADEQRLPASRPESADDTSATARPARRHPRLPRVAAAVIGILVVVGAGTLVRHLAAGSDNDHHGRIVAVPTPAATGRTPGASLAQRQPTRRTLPPHRVSAGRRTAAPAVKPTPQRSLTRGPTMPSPSSLTKVPVTVLNNTTVTGLAGVVARQLQADGWPVSNVSNYTGRVSATTVFYDAGVASEARAAKSLAAQFPAIQSAQPRFAGLPGSGLTVVLAPNWAG